MVDDESDGLGCTATPGAPGRNVVVTSCRGRDEIDPVRVSPARIAGVSRSQDRVEVGGSIRHQARCQSQGLRCRRGRDFLLVQALERDLGDELVLGVVNTVAALQRGWVVATTER
jgi:hypothetical protein